MSDQIKNVQRYHELSKHHFRSFAAGPGYLDWENQPNPFRRYEGAPEIFLDRPEVGSVSVSDDASPDYETALETSTVLPSEMSRLSISQLFFDSLALSAWKAIRGQKWALRINPSSGNLHPTEAYWVSGPIQGLSHTPWVGHYAPLDHLLELRTEFSLTSWSEISRGFPAGTGFIGLTSIHWREAWKYGERAFRYCQHDVGHAIAAISIAAAGLGWSVRLVDHWSHENLRTLLGLKKSLNEEGSEVEHPDCLLAIIPFQSPEVGVSGLNKVLQSSWVAEFTHLIWNGSANRLSSEHVNWGGIDEVTLACEKPETSPELYSKEKPVKFLIGRESHSELLPVSLRKMIHQRRSAVDFDGEGGITRKAFYDMLVKTVPCREMKPLDTLPWAPHVHLVLYVHRVEGLAPGIYIIIRNPEHQNELRKLMGPELLWETPEECPTGLLLYRLVVGDARSLAKQLSCGQDIAADGAFSLGMVAQFETPISKFGSWFYPRLFWECGMIGQVLYLAAEAIGIRGTGIGCFFDDPVHASIGMTGISYQSLYHFTVGIPVEDARLTTLAAYSSTPKL